MGEREDHHQGWIADFIIDDVRKAPGANPVKGTLEGSALVWRGSNAVCNATHFSTQSLGRVGAPFAIPGNGGPVLTGR
jgi:hypothetical protein